MSNTPVPPIDILTGGLTDPGSSLVTGGFGLVPAGATLPSPSLQVSDAQVAAIQSQAIANQGPSIGAPFTILDQNGVPLVSGTDITNSGTDLITNPALPITSALPGYNGDNLTGLQDTVTTYTGSDLRIIVDVVDAYKPWQTNVRLTKQLIECTTLTVSVHRVKDPVRACSFINPKGFARGGRTIAGTIILTQSTVDTLVRFLSATLWNDTSKDSGYVKVDQLPPMDFTLVFADEYGNSSYRRILGVDFLTDGTVYSINDSYTEQTISYVAADFTPLLPFTLSCLSNVQRPSSMAQTTPGDLIRASASNSLNNPLTSGIVKTIGGLV